MKLLLNLSALLILSACTQVIQDRNISTHTQCDSKLSYCIDLGASLNGRDWTDNWTGPTGAPSDHTASNGLNPEDLNYVRLDLFSSASPCSPSFTGVSKEESINTISWGKVDYWDLYAPMFDFPNMVEPLCLPPEQGVAYAMCSQKDGKTVVVCLSQMTNDPKQAEEIFSTFRWNP